MQSFWLCFVPLFVAVDAIGTIPMYISLTEGIPRRRLYRVLVQSTVTALAVALAFLWGGKGFLKLMGITVPDFMIAGGIILFAFSLLDLFAEQKSQGKVDVKSLGAVPLGVPLIIGPGALTTILLLIDAHGYAATVSATVATVIITVLIFLVSTSISKMLGETGVKTISKISALLLAAYAVMMVRKGLMAYLSA